MKGFTLLEVVLAIALSATLLVLIASAMSVFAYQVDDGRQRVEQARLSRNLFQLVSSDLRNIAVYAPQDTAIAAELAKSSGAFDVDLITGGGTGGGSGGGTGGGAGNGTGGGTGGGASSGSSGSGATGGSESAGSDTTSQYQQPLGVYGNLNELQIDVLQPARPMPAPPNATGGLAQDATTAPLWQGGLRTIRYFCREGNRPSGDSLVAERFNSTSSVAYGGLIREELDRQQMNFATQMGMANNNTGTGRILAPEVLAVQFRYSDGTQIYEMWDSSTQQALPVAIEVRMWLQPPANESERASRTTSVDLAEAAQYVMTIPIWRATIVATGTASSGESSGSTEGNSGTGGGATSGSGTGGSSGGGSSNMQ